MVPGERLPAVGRKVAATITVNLGSSNAAARRACMDLSIVATIGFTTIAVIGIFILIFAAGRAKGGK